MNPSTDRFKLQEIEASDISFIHKGLSDPEVTRYYDVHFSSLEATKEQMDWYADLKSNGTGLWWKILYKDSEQCCGAGGFNALDKKHRKAEIGFWLLPEYWGRGIMSEVMPVILNYGFENLYLNRIEGIVESENEKCRQAMNKINFRHEGRMRQAEQKHGKFIDLDIYAALREDWYS
ncbi:GNAT family N-acetyltransferase [Christiangramia salexigens]|uniref:GNAT family N-acetyltransferase n=1 Tax=Christiangramia salexigens TaxID=1913577 RepID=A0A1L3J430_9FLAO|nr:GNAT family protein [Christiangramia salexigens]APG59888.1 GNAT family N-acetyltransferase [Christiangramia salexigens]